MEGHFFGRWVYSGVTTASASFFAQPPICFCFYGFSVVRKCACMCVCVCACVWRLDDRYSINIRSKNVFALFIGKNEVGWIYDYYCIESIFTYFYSGVSFGFR